MPDLLTPDALQTLFKGIFAEWVQRLDLRVQDIAPKSVQFAWKTKADLVRGADQNRMVSGQATMAAADTASVLTIFAMNGGLRNCTTVDLHINFLRPLFEGDVEIEVTALAAGRKTVTTRVEFRMKGSDKLAATATCAFMYID